MSYQRLEDGTLEVRYEPTRAEVWRYYVALWRRTLWKLHLILVPVMLVSFTFDAVALFGRGAWPWGLGLALALWAWMPLSPLVRYRSGERLLRIGEPGFEVTVGRKTWKRRWNRFSRLEQDAGNFYLSNHRFAALIIARRFFASPAEAEDFAAAARALIPPRRK